MNKYLQIIEHYGVNNQQRKLMEELFELQEAITEYELLSDNKVLYSDSYLNKSHEHIAEELADVMLILRQFKEYYKIPDKKLDMYNAYKIERVLKRIDNE